MSWPVAGFNEDFDLGKQQQALGACLRARLTHPRGSPGSEGAGRIWTPRPRTPRAPRRRTRTAPHRFSLHLPSYLGSRCGGLKPRRWQPVAGMGRRVCPLRLQPPLWVRQHHGWWDAGTRHSCKTCYRGTGGGNAASLSQTSLRRWPGSQLVWRQGRSG